MSDDEIKEVEATLVPARDMSAVVALEKAQIDQQIATAKAYPRSLQKFKNDVLTWATIDAETAESMTYLLPSRGENGKPIEGPSVRLAEIAGSAWGNVQYGATVIEEGEEFLTARGFCVDFERNVRIVLDVRRSIKGKYGRFKANMIQVAGQAACSIALRNAIFKVIPLAFIKPAWEQAKKVARGDEKTLAVRRDAALAYFKEKGVDAQRVFGFLGIAGKEDVTLEHLQQMTAIRTAVKDGEASIDDFFGEQTVKVSAPDNLDAFTAPASVKAQDDPGPVKKAEPVVEATLVEPEKEPEKPKGKKARTKEDDELDKLFK